MRIFPEMCASTLCPFSSSTRNMALGSGSTTVPSTRIVSSLGLARTLHLLRAGRAERRAKTFLGRPTMLYGPAPDSQSDISPARGRRRRAIRHACVPNARVRASARKREDLGAVVGDGDGVL